MFLLSGRTRRHLSEFWMIEAEIAFVNDIEDILDVMESLIKHVAKSVIDNHSEDITVYAKSAKVEDRREYIASLLESKFHRITFETARNKSNFGNISLVALLVTGHGYTDIRKSAV